MIYSLTFLWFIHLQWLILYMRILVLTRRRTISHCMLNGIYVLWIMILRYVSIFFLLFDNLLNIMHTRLKIHCNVIPFMSCLITIIHIILRMLNVLILTQLIGFTKAASNPHALYMKYVSTGIYVTILGRNSSDMWRITHKEYSWKKYKHNA